MIDKHFTTMRKMLFTLVLPLFLLGGSAAARRTTVVVEVPGTLPQLIPAADKYRIESLTLKGRLDGTDLRYLREMAGSDARMQPTPGRLTDIDLSGVTFAPGGAIYIYKDAPQRPQGPHTLPKFLFRLTRVERVVLPARTDTIGVGALEYARLRRVVLPSNVYIGNYAFSNNPNLTEVVMPEYISYVGLYVFDNCPRIAELRFNHVGYVAAWAFANMPGIERIEFRGNLGHIDGYNTFLNCPRLRSVRFGGPVLTTGGPSMFVNCPALTDVTFDGPVMRTALGQAQGCPLLKKYQANGIVAQGIDTTCIDGPGIDFDAESAACDDALDILLSAYGYLHGVTLSLPAFTRNTAAYLFYRQATRWASREPQKALAYLTSAVDAGFNDGARLAADSALAPLHAHPQLAELDSMMDGGDSYLDVLRATPAYAGTMPFTYAAPTDSGLRRVREFFNLDSIAGQGDEISRIKRLMYWVHDHIPHDGGSSWPDCPYNAVDLYQVTQRDDRGLNCRFLAMVLNEMYLAVGFKARFLTCQSRQYATDPDCHVINVVWSDSLRKWVWMDPSFAAYVTDERGLLLHPGEVRQRLIDGRPLVLNDDANWNHRTKQTKAHYLEEYMAKNLYLISAHRHFGCQTEGRGARPDNPEVTLVPQGFPYRNSYTTSDPDYFWQAPE